MLGKPKFKRGDKVTFTLEDKEYQGEVYIVDALGTFFDKSDVSYDIMAVYEGQDILFKHINEKYVK